MLFENEVFVPATDALLSSVVRQRTHNAVFDAAYTMTRFDSVSPETAVCPAVGTMETWTEEFYPFYNKLSHPVDALIEIIDATGAIIGWQVTVWYNEDDMDDDYDYEKDTEEWD